MTMKKIKKLILPLLCTSVLSYSLVSCKDNKETQSEENKHEDKVVEDVKPPEQIVSIDQAREMYNNYSKHRVEVINDYEMRTRTDSNFEAARYSSYDYETIKQYLAYVEQEAKKANVNISTLRFYFSNYPDKKIFENGKKIIHPKQNSFFMLPTLEKDGENFGFYVVDVDGKTEARLIKNAPQNSEKGMGTNNSVKDTKSYATFGPNLINSSPIIFQNGHSLIMNEGTAGPPPKGDF